MEKCNVDSVSHPGLWIYPNTRMKATEQHLSVTVYYAFKFYDLCILGDPGAVSRVGRKGATKVFKYGRKSPWVPTLTELFRKIQADAGS